MTQTQIEQSIKHNQEVVSPPQTLHLPISLLQNKKVLSKTLAKPLDYWKAPVSLDCYIIPFEECRRMRKNDQQTAKNNKSDPEQQNKSKNKNKKKGKKNMKTTQNQDSSSMLSNYLHTRDSKYNTKSDGTKTVSNHDETSLHIRSMSSKDGESLNATQDRHKDEKHLQTLDQSFEKMDVSSRNNNNAKKETALEESPANDKISILSESKSSVSSKKTTSRSVLLTADNISSYERISTHNDDNNSINNSNNDQDSLCGLRSVSSSFLGNAPICSSFSPLQSPSSEYSSLNDQIQMPMYIETPFSDHSFDPMEDLDEKKSSKNSSPSFLRDMKAEIWGKDDGEGRKTLNIDDNNDHFDHINSSGLDCSVCNYEERSFHDLPYELLVSL